MLKQLVQTGRIRIVILVLLVLVALFSVYNWITVGHGWDDWTVYFRPAALIMLYGGSPYGTGYYNAPWGLVLFIPLALLPYQIGRFLFFVLSVAGFAYIARRLTDTPLSMLLFMTSVPVVFCLDLGNIDWLSMLALVTPAPFALMLAAIKPQVGAGIAIYWFVVSWRQGGVRLAVRNFLPVSLLLIASFFLYGFWPLSFATLNSMRWNFSIFPYTIPVGIFLLWRSIVRQDPRPSMPVGILISPYFTIISLSTLLVGLLEHPKILAVAWLVVWLGVVALAVFK